MVRLVSLSNEAYATLSSLKRAGESFSRVVLRVCALEKKAMSPLDFAGAWGTEGGDRETQRMIDGIYTRRRATSLRRYSW